MYTSILRKIPQENDCSGIFWAVTNGIIDVSLCASICLVYPKKDFAFTTRHPFPDYYSCLTNECVPTELLKN